MYIAMSFGWKKLKINVIHQAIYFNCHKAIKNKRCKPWCKWEATILIFIRDNRDITAFIKMTNLEFPTKARVTEAHVIC